MKPIEICQQIDRFLDKFEELDRVVAGGPAQLRRHVARDKRQISARVERLWLRAHQGDLEAWYNIQCELENLDALIYQINKENRDGIEARATVVS